MTWPFSLPPLPVQAAALAAARGQDGFGFFMDPGTGKTGLTMAEFTLLADEGQVDVMLVVCPNNLCMNWKHEAHKMGFKFPVAIYPEKCPDRGMWVFNYEKLITKAFDDINRVLARKKFYMVCDESHRIKNFKAKSSKSAIYIQDKARIRRVMTGTPLANNVVDLWAQLRAIDRNHPHRNPYTFRNRYGVMGGWMGKQIVGTQREDELKAIIDSCSFSAKKKDWMKTLPPKAYYTLSYEMTGKQAKMYRDIYKERFLALDDSEISAQMVITALMKMQQITSGFMMDDTGNVVSVCDWAETPKIQVVSEQLHEIPNKVILFAHYRETIDRLCAMLDKDHKQWTRAVIRGGSKKADVESAKKEFNDNDFCRFLVAQTASAKEGLTLLGSKLMPCDTTIFVENTYSIIDRTQAEDRNHRHGQESAQVSYYDLVGSSIEESIISALQDKTNLIETIMEKRNV